MSLKARIAATHQSSRWRHRHSPSFAFLLCLALQPLGGAAEILLKSPQDYQVFQRSTAEAGAVLIEGALPEKADAPETVEVEWSDGLSAASWREAAVVPAGQAEFRAILEFPAGGWRRLAVRSKRGGVIHGRASVAHVGVGEVFLVAGQSNSANHGEERQKPATGLVSAYTGAGWQLAEDPQPGASGTGGSFLPPFGDQIARRFNVPVGFIGMGVGATSVREWLPAGVRFPQPPTLIGNVIPLESGGWESRGTLFNNLAARLKQFGPGGIRAVLWHQGESDANQREAARTLPGKLYQEFLARIIREARREAGWELPWFAAQASYHTPDDPGSPDIRAAQAALWESGIALEGPDTDALAGHYRDSQGQGVHFSGAGLRAHGEKWAEKVAPWLEQQLRRKAEKHPAPLLPKN